MSKRKISQENYEQLLKKLKGIEDELRRHKGTKEPVKRSRVRVLSSSSESSEDASTLLSQKYDNEVCVQPSNDKAGDHGAPLGPACFDVAYAANADTADMAGTAYAAESVDAADTEQNPLDVEVLEILGVDPTTAKTYGNEIQKDLAVRLEHSAIEGLSKDNRKELMDTYLVPSNCKLIGAPILNPELKAALSEPVIKRDKAIEAKQKVTAAAIASLSQAISLTISSKEKDTTLLRLLMDTGRMLCDCQHSDTMTRRNYVISSIKKDMKESLQSAKADNFLFGDKLPDTLKAAKAINKSGAELKIITTPKPGPSKKFTTPASSSKNWKTNPPRKVAPAATKETAMKNQRASSSKTSQPRRHSRR